MSLDIAIREERHYIRFAGVHFEWGKLRGSRDNRYSAPFSALIRTPAEFT